MPETPTYALPDVELAGEQGHMVNPSYFAGHDLVVLFCPSDRQTAAHELADYNARSSDLTDNDAYMVAICDPEAGAPASRILVATDAKRAWDAFSGCLNEGVRPYPEKGAAFLFGRGGCLRETWEGVGHATEVMRALGERM